MKRLIFTIISIGLVFLSSCSSPERRNYLLNGDIETGMYIEGFRLDDTSQTVDFNNISGYVGIAIRNIPIDASKVFVYVDHVEIGRWMRGGICEQEWFGFESDRFSNVWHKVKLVSINFAGEVRNHPPIDAYFNNLLYNVSSDEHFHPDEDYHFSGFYDGGNSLEVKLTDIHGTVIWSNTYSGNYIDITIPGSAFGAEQLCSIDINEVQSCAKGMDLVVPDGNEKQARTSIEFFYADKYFVPPIDKTVAILLYPPYSDSGSYQPMALFGDKELTEKLMGKSLEPKITIEGRGWLEKIMDAYRTTLKKAEERQFHRNGYPNVQVIFVTMKNGYMRSIDVEANTVYDNYMESSILKAYFDELGLTKESSSREPKSKGKIREVRASYHPYLNDPNLIKRAKESQEFLRKEIKKRMAEEEAEAQRKIEEENQPD